ncbi:MAG TPA: TadE family protein [Acidimicrobiales bacterium]|nr:TadE family protein [Acidimicrobiales bacterium]
MRPRRHKGDRRRDESGATLVEFALVAPVVFMLLFGIIAGCFLAYQNSSLHDGATAGARMASIETYLVPPPPSTGPYCESGVPTPIETAVAKATPLLTVNPAPLCASTANATQLTQPIVNGDVNITVNCGGIGGCASPSSTQVVLTLSTKGLVAPIGLTYNLSASSEDPVLNPCGTCP